MIPEGVINTTAIMQTRQPEKRKVDSSILSLTTSFGLVSGALTSANADLGACVPATVE